MIHSARPTVLPVVNIVFDWDLFCFEYVVGTDWRTEEWTDDMCKNNDHFMSWLWVGRVDQQENHSCFAARIW